jgi:hypothetical protein
MPSAMSPGLIQPCALKVIRLRYFAGMPQGAIVTGGDDNKQMVFNAQTGRAVSETEPGYPPVGFPFSWQAHQLAKDVHRGGIIGLSGRFMDLFAGLAMFYLFRLRNLDLCRSLETPEKGRKIHADLGMRNDG